MTGTCEKCGNSFKTYPSKPRRFCSIPCALVGKNIHRGVSSSQWKGDQVGYKVLHKWVAKQLGKPRLCMNCGSTTASRYEWANVSGDYKRHVTDWIRMCVKCHRNFDDLGKNQRGVVRSQDTIDKAIASSTFAKRTHCKNGHEFNLENTIRTKPNAERPRGRRVCRVCASMAAKKYYARKRSKTNVQQ